MPSQPEPGPPELRFPTRPRRRVWLVIALGLACGAMMAAVRGQPSAIGMTGADLPTTVRLVSASSTDEAAPTPRTDDEPAAGPEEAELATDPALPPPFGEVDGLVLRLPADEFEVLGFHEASSGSHAMEPIGRLLANENRTRFEPVSDRDDGVDYHVLSSRGRVHPPTSAIDIVLRDDVPVLAPVTGVVADVRTYHLYGRYLDHRVEIHPQDAPHLRVVLVHLDDVVVVAGDVVAAGESVLARTANRFPFASQIDRETEPDRWPHVHLEVQPIDAPRPGDPPPG